MGRIAIINDPTICTTYGDEYAIVELDARGTWSNVVGCSVRVIETSRTLGDAQNRLPIWVNG